jgi:1,4-dihydroxy-6-naphthoate synthase
LVLQQYKVLNSGGALGKGVGPLLITKHQTWTTEEVNNARIAIPGINTTAHLLFSLAFPSAKNKSFHVFHEIEELVLSGQVDAGVIIHENRFTYQQKGLHKIMDLGDHWEQQTGVPIPLGGIVAHNRLVDSVALQVNDLIKKSVEYAFSHYPEVANYVKENAQEMSEEVMRQHINLYVNEFSIDLGIQGKQAVTTLLNIAEPDFGNKAATSIFLSNR